MGSGGGRVDWHGERYKAALRKAVDRRLSTASVYLASRIKADVSQPGTLRWSGGRDGKGRFLSKTVYNFTHSAPGNPPYKQTGRLRSSVTWEVVTELGRTRGRVGSNVKYARALDQGYKGLKRRPYLGRNLQLASPVLARILTQRVRPNELGSPASNQFRSGVAGRNFGRFS